MNIKDYREKELKIFVIANILVVLGLLGMITFDGLIEKDSYMQLLITIINSSLFASIIYTMVTVFDCMISNSVKKVITFWWSPMPGETIFSDIKSGAKDNRFTTLEATTAYYEIYEKLPKEKKARRKYENSKWYDLLCQNELEPKILNAHREYLMCRDMTTSIILMVIVYVVLSTVVKLVLFDKNVIIYLTAMYVACMIATRVKSKRFVKTVIACDLHSKKKKKRELKTTL